MLRAPEGRRIGSWKALYLTLILVIIPWLAYEYYLSVIGSTPISRHQVLQEILLHPALRACRLLCISLREPVQLRPYVYRAIHFAGAGIEVSAADFVAPFRYFVLISPVCLFFLKSRSSQELWTHR